MTIRVDSSKSVIAASFLALVVFLWGVLLDWHFVVGEWGFNIPQTGLAALIYVAILSGWIWSLIALSAGSRRALHALLVYALLQLAFALLDLFVYCPTTCPQIWLYYIANWGNLIFSVVSGASILLRTRASPSA
jgi:hypothetical protein